jgi:hypothetical protein
MVVENSGKIYRFKLEHNLGFGFAEVYDFTDLSIFDGRVVYVFNRLDKEEKPSYTFSEIRNTGIAIGPIRLNKFPNVRGLHAWKFLLRATDLLMNEIPVTKSLQGLVWKEDDWNNFKKKWYSSNFDIKKELPTYVDYEKVRHLETTILHTPVDVVTKFTMKVILDSNEKVSDYYNLSENENRFPFIQLINTYYPLVKTKKLLNQLALNRK